MGTHPLGMLQTAWDVFVEAEASSVCVGVADGVLCVGKGNGEANSTANVVLVGEAVGG
jgi:hypothetical protein